MRKIKEIKGLVTYKQLMKESKVLVLLTADENGATLSLASKDDDFMITIPMEEAEDIIKVVKPSNSQKRRHLN